MTDSGGFKENETTSAGAKPVEPQPASHAEWTVLIARLMEEVTRRELHQLEANITSSIHTAVERALAGLFMIVSTVVGGGCLLAALILLLGRWFEWWFSLLLAGAIVIAAGKAVYSWQLNRA